MDKCKVCFIYNVYDTCRGCSIPICMTCSYRGPYCGLCQVAHKFVAGEDHDIIQHNMHYLTGDDAQAHISQIRFRHANAYRQQLTVFWWCLCKSLPKYAMILKHLMPTIAQKIRLNLPPLRSAGSPPPQ